MVVGERLPPSARPLVCLRRLLGHPKPASVSPPPPTRSPRPTNPLYERGETASSFITGMHATRVLVSPIHQQNGPSSPPATMASQEPPPIACRHPRRAQAPVASAGSSSPADSLPETDPANSSGGLSTLRTYANGMLAPNNRRRIGRRRWQAGTRHTVDHVLIATLGSCRQATLGPHGEAPAPRYPSTPSPARAELPIDADLQLPFEPFRSLYDVLNVDCAICVYQGHRS